MPNFANPKITGSVQSLINGLTRQATSVTVTGTKPLPPWWSSNPVKSLKYHFQGIAPYNLDGQQPANGVICASSTVGYFALFNQGLTSTTGTVQDVTVPNADYFHTGGMQMLGGLLPVALESNKTGRMGLVSFYDVGKYPIEALYSFNTPSTKSSATAITTYTGSDSVEYALLFVYEYDNEQMYVYRGTARKIDKSATQDWTLVTTYTGSAFRTGDQYQNFALVTQTGSNGDAVFLLGFREDEELDFWTISTTTGTTFGTPTFVKKYRGWSGSDWANGVGLQIASSTKLRLYGTDKDPVGTSNYPDGQANYTFKIYLYE